MDFKQLLQAQVDVVWLFKLKNAIYWQLSMAVILIIKRDNVVF